MAQETFLAVLRAVQRYEPRATFRAYLFGIAFNILAAHRRKSGLNATQSDSTREDVSDPSGTNPENVIWVRQAVDRLDVAEREVLLLREFEELSYEEIAKILRAPVNTVRSRLFRARMALREILATTPGNLGGRK